MNESTLPYTNTTPEDLNVAPSTIYFFGQHGCLYHTTKLLFKKYLECQVAPMAYETMWHSGVQLNYVKCALNMTREPNDPGKIQMR